MEEKIQQSPWTITKSEEEEDVISKIFIVGHDSLVIEDEMIQYEVCLQPVYQTMEK